MATTPTLNPELVTALKRLKLGRIADTLPERLVLADKQDMTFDELLLLIITDEIARRDSCYGATLLRDGPRISRRLREGDGAGWRGPARAELARFWSGLPSAS